VYAHRLGPTTAGCPAGARCGRGRLSLKINGMRNSISALAVALFVVSGTLASSGAPPASSGPPVTIAVSVSPETIAAGSETSVTVQLDPKPGIKLNKYPKIKLQVPAVEGLVAAAEQSMGNPAPPPGDQLDANYFHGSVDPLKVTLRMDSRAAKGRHDLRAKLSYFYCVAASGYCAPGKTEVTIPLTIR
jgi:hypothetical protein